MQPSPLQLLQLQQMQQMQQAQGMGDAQPMQQMQQLQMQMQQMQQLQMQQLQMQQLQQQSLFQDPQKTNEGHMPPLQMMMMQMMCDAWQVGQGFQRQGSPTRDVQASPTEQLVERLKTLQRSSAKAKQAWENYCTESGTKFFDPWRHETSFLEAFFEKLEKGEFGDILQESQGASQPPHELVERVKLLQRSSPEGKAAWEKYCQTSKTTFFDPGKHDAAFLETFLTALEAGQFGNIEIPEPSCKGRGKAPGRGPPEPLDGPDIETHKVFVASLPRSTTEEALRSHFSQFGEVQDVVMKYDSDGVFRCFAFITFVEATIARQILENYDNNSFQGKWVPCVPVKMRKGHTKQGGKGVGLVEAGRKLFIRNLPLNTNEDSLRIWAGYFGEVESLKLVTNGDGSFRGFAFIWFKDDGTVAKVVENYNDNYFEGKWIECRVAGVRPEDNLPPGCPGRLGKGMGMGMGMMVRGWSGDSRWAGMNGMNGGWGGGCCNWGPGFNDQGCWGPSHDPNRADWDGMAPWAFGKGGKAGGGCCPAGCRGPMAWGQGMSEEQWGCGAMVEGGGWGKGCGAWDGSGNWGMGGCGVANGMAAMGGCGMAMNGPAMNGNGMAMGGCGMANGSMGGEGGSLGGQPGGWGPDGVAGACGCGVPGFQMMHGAGDGNVVAGGSQPSGSTVPPDAEVQATGAASPAEVAAEVPSNPVCDSVEGNPSSAAEAGAALEPAPEQPSGIAASEEPGQGETPAAAEADRGAKRPPADDDGGLEEAKRRRLEEQ